MSDFKFIGKNYQTPDLVAKVTGQAKYAEDFRAEGMLFCKQLLSPEPHARVRHVDARAALAMSGVAAVLTADDLPIAQRAQTCRSSRRTRTRRGPRCPKTEARPSRTNQCSKVSRFSPSLQSTRPQP